MKIQYFSNKLILFSLLFVTVLSFSSCGKKGITTNLETVGQEWSDLTKLYKQRANLFPEVLVASNNIENVDKDKLRTIAANAGEVLNYKFSGTVSPEDISKISKSQNQIGAFIKDLHTEDIKNNSELNLAFKKVEGLQNQIDSKKESLNGMIKSYNKAINSFPAKHFVEKWGFGPIEEI